MTRHLPVRIGDEYPVRPRKHQVPCSHRQGVEHGAFCISGFCTPLSRCNTLDFVPKSCAKGCCAPWNPCSHRLWAMWICRTESSLTKAHPAVCGAEKALLRKCNNPLLHFHPCGLQSVVGSPRGNGCIGCVSGESLRTCVREVGTHVRSKMAKFSYIGVFFHWRVWYTQLNKSEFEELIDWTNQNFIKNLVH